MMQEMENEIRTFREWQKSKNNYIAGSTWF